MYKPKRSIRGYKHAPGPERVVYFFLKGRCHVYEQCIRPSLCHALILFKMTVALKEDVISSIRRDCNMRVLSKPVKDHKIP